MTSTREQAVTVATEVAQRLAGPEWVAASATAPDNVDRLANGDVRHPWLPGSLGSGHAGIALLFSDLSRPDFAAAGHSHLRAAVECARPGVRGLYHGLAGVGMAALAAARHRDDYAGLLSAVDSYVGQEVDALVGAERARIAAGRPGTGVSTFDLIDGATGLGVYLLRRPGLRARLTDILGYLAALVEPVEVGGRQVPGWWSPGSPTSLGTARPGDGPGHLNLGVAHGISGPLALMSLALRGGVRVAGVDRAMGLIRDWLAGELVSGPAGPYWPTAVSPAEDGAGLAAGDRSAWCYGTPGVAYAMHLAAIALGQPAQADQALALLWTSTDRAERTGVLTDSGVCHGWAGLLTMVCQVAGRRTQDGRSGQAWSELADRLAGRILAAYEPDAPFGFRYRNPYADLGPDRCGLLEGCAGIALALLTYARDPGQARQWPMALLLR